LALVSATVYHNIDYRILGVIRGFLFDPLVAACGSRRRRVVLLVFVDQLELRKAPGRIFRRGESGGAAFRPLRGTSLKGAGGLACFVPFRYAVLGCSR